MYARQFVSKWGLAKLAFFALIVLATTALLVSCSSSAKSSSSDSSESSSPASEGSSIKEVELSQTTEYLEYSPKDVDPTTLVSTNNDAVSVTTEDAIDLFKVGTQTVKYKLSAGEDSDIREIQFVVRDTKAPEIELSNSSPTIDQGGSLDPQSCISKVSDPVDGDLPIVDSEPEAQGVNAGLEQFYDGGWYVVTGSVDSNTPGTYPLTVKASDKHGNVETKEIVVRVKEVAPPPAEQAHTYIANKNTHKFHIGGCSEIKKMKDSNKVEITATREEMIEMGYKPCGRCNP